MKLVRSFLLVTCLLATVAATALAVPQSPIIFKDAVPRNLPQPKFKYPEKVDLTVTTSNKKDQGVGKLPKTSIEVTLTKPEDMATLTHAGTTYKFKELHFHIPAEHKLDGVAEPFAMEMHMVHAVHPDNGPFLAVGRWIKEVENKAHELDKIFQNLPAMPAENATATKAVDMFMLNKLLPDDPSQFFRYEGSLTTFKTQAEKDAGESTTNVRWIMFKDPLELSKAQIALFKGHDAKTGARTAIAMNKDMHMLQMHMVPEPSTVWLLAVAGLVARRRRRR
jgi:carbonic anhydrase